MNTKQRFINELNVPLHVLLNDDPKFIDTLEAMLQSGEAPEIRATEYAGSVAGIYAHKSIEVDKLHKEAMQGSNMTEAYIDKLVSAHSAYNDDLDPYWDMLQHYLTALSILVAIKECNIYRLQVMQQQAAQRHHDLNCKECSPKVATDIIQ